MFMFILKLSDLSIVKISWVYCLWEVFKEQ